MRNRSREVDQIKRVDRLIVPRSRLSFLLSLDWIPVVVGFAQLVYQWFSVARRPIVDPDLVILKVQ